MTSDSETQEAARRDSLAKVQGRGSLSRLTGDGNWFEDFLAGQRFRHARGATIGEFENNFVSKQVMNTAQAHWNAHIMRHTGRGDGRVVFGLVTASLTLGLASQDTCENALAEISLDKLRFRAPVHHGDTIYAYTEVLGTSPVADRPDAGLVRFKHWGVRSDGAVVFEGERVVLVKRRASWVTQ